MIRDYLDSQGLSLTNDAERRDRQSDALAGAGGWDADWETEYTRRLRYHIDMVKRFNAAAPADYWENPTLEWRDEIYAQIEREMNEIGQVA